VFLAAAVVRENVQLPSKINVKNKLAYASKFLGYRNPDKPASEISNLPINLLVI